MVALPLALSRGSAAQDSLKVEIVPQLAHPGRGMILSGTFSPDGSTVLSGGNSGLKLWDVATGRLVRTMIGHSANYNVSSVAFSPDGRRVLSGSADKTLKL